MLHLYQWIWVRSAKPKSAPSGKEAEALEEGAEICTNLIIAFCLVNQAYTIPCSEKYHRTGGKHQGARYRFDEDERKLTELVKERCLDSYEIQQKDWSKEQEGSS